jgi:hypothetical protein
MLRGDLNPTIAPVHSCSGSAASTGGPNAQVVGIDVGPTSLEETQRLIEAKVVLDHTVSTSAGNRLGHLA